MREMFKAFYTPTEEEFNELWEKALIVLDTNALLNLYRYSENTYRSYLKILTEYKDRLWMPYTVGREFHKNRYESKYAQHEFYAQIIASLEAYVDKFKEPLGKCRYHRFLDTDDILKKFKSGIEAQIDDIKATEKKHQEFMDNDEILTEVTDLYEGKVGEPFETENYKELCKKGKQRYECKTPPGYKDRDSQRGNSQYGDYLIWEAMIDKASESKQDIIFVTDDGKEDWWLSLHGKTVGPRTELLEEFINRSKQTIHFYKPDRFHSYASEKLKLKVEESVTEEISSISNRRAIKELPVREILNYEKQLQRYDSLLKQIEICKEELGENPELSEALEVFEEDRRALEKFLNENRHLLVLLIKFKKNNIFKDPSMTIGSLWKNSIRTGIAPILGKSFRRHGSQNNLGCGLLSYDSNHLPDTDEDI